MKRERYRSALWGPQALLDDDTCELLSSVGPFEDHSKLETLLKSRWSRWNELGEVLFNHLHALHIPPLPPPKRRARQGPAPDAICSPPRSNQPPASKRPRLQDSDSESDDSSDVPLLLRSSAPTVPHSSPTQPTLQHVAHAEYTGMVMSARAPLAHLCRPLNPAVPRRSLPRHSSPHHAHSITEPSGSRPIIISNQLPSTASSSHQSQDQPVAYSPRAEQPPFSDFHRLLPLPHLPQLKHTLPAPTVPQPYLSESPNQYSPQLLKSDIDNFMQRKDQAGQRSDVPTDTGPHTGIYTSRTTSTPPIPGPLWQCLNPGEHEVKGPMLILHEGEKRCLYCILSLRSQQ